MARVTRAGISYPTSKDTLGKWIEDAFSARNAQARYDLINNMRDHFKTLSQAQIALLSTFMRHPNQVLTREQLISLTFNDEFDGFDRAVDSQIARLRRQITRNGRQPIQTVYGAGYRFVVEDE